MSSYENDITRYCYLINAINEKVSHLKAQERIHYDGGYSFEEIHKYDIKKLEEMKSELSELLEKITPVQINK
jgi:hypothetical protein